jgi:hypothetical protein
MVLKTEYLDIIKRIIIKTFENEIRKIDPENI